MARGIGVVVSGHATLGIVEENRIAGTVIRYPSDEADADLVRSMPAAELVQILADEVKRLIDGEDVQAVGLAFPGIIRGGLIEECPNLQQLKGFPIESAICAALQERGISVTVTASNDADVVASGIAAAHGQLDKLIRVWTLGDGIGFGRYPIMPGVWEGGHMVVTLDPNEKFCACGGLGHLESIMGHRAMRLRFLDMEPEEVFAAAKSGEEPRCAEFAILWHRALAAATASSIHMSGPGKFYITGNNARFVNIAFLNRCIQEMVKMSPLQGYALEVVPRSDEIAVVGAVVNALRVA
jgi:predicted NBD/HSP70 family sugar kinase